MEASKEKKWWGTTTSSLWVKRLNMRLLKNFMRVDGLDIKAFGQHLQK
jgi:hypothetical protein